MDTDTFRSLKRIHTKYGTKRFGKIAQKLLALAFYQGGFEHVVEREVQGVDIDAAKEDADRYALEVKTTEGQSVPVTQDNVDALLDRMKDGYTPILAVLRLQMFEGWVFARVPIDRLKPGNFSTSRLRAYRLPELEALIDRLFADVVDKHGDRTFEEGSSYLSDVLKSHHISQEK